MQGYDQISINIIYLSLSIGKYILYNWTSEFLILDNQIITRWCDGIFVSCMRYRYQWYINGKKLIQGNKKIKSNLISDITL